MGVKYQRVESIGAMVHGDFEKANVGFNAIMYFIMLVVHGRWPTLMDETC
jgi:hypothetical protein